MKKTISTSIANTLFNIEEDAYQKLEAYLASIKAHFAGNPDSDEIIKDIEVRIAERLSELPHTIVTSLDVEAIIADMGTVNQFDAGTDEPIQPSHATARKRLYRDTDSAVLAGVGSGFGHYFGIDPVIVRVVFAVSIFLGGAGIIAYLILWIALPEAKTAAQKLEMRGDPVTLSTVSNLVREKIEEIDGKQAKEGVRKGASIIGGFLKGLARFIQRFFFPALRVVVGSLLTLTGFMVAIGASIMLGVTLFNLPSTFLAFPTEGLLRTPIFYVAAIGFYFVVLIPSILVFFAGLRVMQRKTSLTKKVVASLLVLWALAIVATGIAASRFAIRMREFISTSPAYQEVTQDVTLEPFANLVVTDAIRVTYMKGNTYSARISGRNYDLERLSVAVEESTLTVERNGDRIRCGIFCDQRPVTVIVTAPSLESITARDASRIDGSITSVGTLTATAQDASSIRMEITAKNFVAIASDASRIEPTGSADTLRVTLEDASSYRGFGLLARSATALLSDASRAEIHASVTLSVTAHDASRVVYAGDPQIKAETNDISSIQKKTSTPQE